MRKRGQPYMNPAGDAYNPTAYPDSGIKTGANNRKQRKTLSGPVETPRHAVTRDEYTHGRSTDWKPADSADRVAHESERGNYID